MYRLINNSQSQQSYFNIFAWNLSFYGKYFVKADLINYEFLVV